MLSTYTYPAKIFPPLLIQPEYVMSTETGRYIEYWTRVEYCLENPSERSYGIIDFVPFQWDNAPNLV